MTALMIFWSVLAVAALAVAIITRITPLIISAFGFGIAAALAWLDYGLASQAGVAVLMLVVGIALWARQVKVPQEPYPNEAGPSRLSGLGALSNFSAFSDESDEVKVDKWDGIDTTVVFRGRVWKAKLAKGAKAEPGLYKVREVRDGNLVLDEVID
jgi:hypothetical protein